MINAAALIPGADIWFMTLDTLRYDVAQDAWRNKDLPNFAKLLPENGWEKRHAPASFTYASHHAMFSGFLPTPSSPGPHQRLFAMSFRGSETTGPQTACFEQATLIEGLNTLDYQTVCIGGVGFFNKENELGSVLPDLFKHSHWSSETSVSNRESTPAQFTIAQDYIRNDAQNLCCFINISALHQPNWFYLDAQHEDNKYKDSIQSHYAALCYVDQQLPTLIEAWTQRSQRRQRPVIVIICSDHGTCYGEDGFQGHRLAHEHIWNVPYLETLIGP